MPISRTGECPIFLKYVTEQALIPRYRQPSQQFQDLTRFNFHWIDVPTFQRGLVWDEEMLEDLLASHSSFLGNAVLGSLPIPSDRSKFSHLPSSVASYEVLIDGLQRFAIGTALLSILFPLVLSDTPERGDDAAFFAALNQARTWAPVFLHNDVELQGHARKAVSDSYKAFRENLVQWVRGRFDAGQAQQFAEQVNKLFLQRQIAPDIYHNFGSLSEVTSTFIGLNTVRVQLNLVDWLRSVVIDQGASIWSPQDIEDLENRFSEIFNQDSGMRPDPELIPLVAVLKEVLTEGSLSDKQKIFPTWGPALQISEVEELLTFVEQFVAYDGNPFVREIRLCGAIPFAAIILYYYRRKIAEGYDASFFEGGTADDVELLALLRAYYRVVLAGKVGKTGEYARRLLLSNVTLSDVADGLSRGFLNGKALADLVDRDWLVAALKSSDQKRSRIVFNACLLPEHGTGTTFSPHRYGKSTNDYQIDHLIPASVIKSNLHQPGGAEGQLLMNFAPISRTTNVRQLNICCAVKLSPGGVYANEVATRPDSHPFVQWLVNNQGSYASHLDNQELLQTAARPPIAQERIDWIAERLLNRL
jgi:hypothetical protein